MTLTPEELKWYNEDGPTSVNINEINSTRFAIGYVTGIYPGEKKEQQIFSVGPNGEKAWTDKYAVFYRKGAFNLAKRCSWVNDIPQGFSCAVGAEPNDCSDRRERFVPVECDKFVLKVAKKIFSCNGDADCLEGVNWN